MNFSKKERWNSIALFCYNICSNRGLKRDCLSTLPKQTRNMNETILLELRLKLAEAQRDVAIAEKNLAAFLANQALPNSHQQEHEDLKTGLSAIMLTELQQHKSLTTDILASKCNTTVQTMRVILHRAKKKGLVKPDKSNGFHEFKSWSLTPKGILEKSYLA